MPAYEYRCEECRCEFEVERSMSDNSKQHCTACGSEKANRIWSVFMMSSGSTPDYGQGTSGSVSSAAKKSGCGSCASKACGSCH